MKQEFLFEIEADWEREWKGMPEYVNEDLPPVKSLQVHFRTKEEYMEFVELVNQRMTMKTKYIWYPCQQKANNEQYRWVNEEES